MSDPERNELSVESVGALLYNHTFTIEFPLLLANNNVSDIDNMPPAPGSIDFITSIIVNTMGKVHILLDETDYKIAMAWLEKWTVTRNPYFIWQQVWDMRERSLVKTIKGIHAGCLDNNLVHIGNSVDVVNNLSQEVPNALTILHLPGQDVENIKVPIQTSVVTKESVSYVYGLFFDPQFWDKKIPTTAT